MSEITKTSEIRFKIGLNEQNVPLDIKWMATDSKNHELRDCKSIMISIWDMVQNQTLKIDLWTNDMNTDEMHSHYFQTLLSMTESYSKATGNPYAVEEMKKFAQQLAKQTAEWEDTKK
ncbi:MAG: gliding motility protein GldC [Bacteroidetes bacterium]|nr:gliding motility protein GldC [Bacteroidota bacterium]